MPHTASMQTLLFVTASKTVGETALGNIFFREGLSAMGYDCEPTAIGMVETNAFRFRRNHGDIQCRWGHGKDIRQGIKLSRCWTATIEWARSFVGELGTGGMRLSEIRVLNIKY